MLTFHPLKYGMDEHEHRTAWRHSPLSPRSASRPAIRWRQPDRSRTRCPFGAVPLHASMSRQMRGGQSSSASPAPSPRYRAPGALADMSCCESSLAANVDVFSGAFANVAGFDVHALVDSYSGGLKSGLSSETITPGVSRAICAHAMERYVIRTSGLTGSLENIVAGFELPEFADGFGPPMANRTASRPVRSSPAASSATSRSTA